MKTLTVDSVKSLKEALEALETGGIVAFPTDTVYGVGAHGFQPEAILRLFEVKKRPRDKSIPLLLARKADIALVAKDIPESAWILAEKFWPGGLTLVLPRQEIVPAVLCAGGETVALRMPDHRIVLDLIRGLGAPLAASSANISGHPDPVTAQEVARELGGRIDMLLDGGRCPGGIPSTVLDLTLSPPRILRAGGVSKEELERCLPGIVWVDRDKSCYNRKKRRGLP